MRFVSCAGRSLLLAGLAGLAGAAGAQQRPPAVQAGGQEMAGASVTSNMPSGSGEASTMTNGVPNLLASNPQPGELGIQSRLSMRPTARTARSGNLSVMGASAAPFPAQAAGHE